MGIQGDDHVGVIDKGKKRRARQKAKEKPKKQLYGGGSEEGARLAARDRREIAASGDAEVRAQEQLDSEREGVRKGVDYLWGAQDKEREDFRGKSEALAGEAGGMRQDQLGRANAYGLGADAAYGDYGAGRGATLGSAARLESNPWMQDYQAGRGAIQGNAGELEGYARNAAAEYQDAAGMAAKAAAERNQRNALAIAAGRGANSVRTALAGANAANAQTALDQQATMAAQNNQLNAMRNQAIASASGIRSGLAGMDQQAAAQQAANTQAAAQIRAGVGAQDLASAQQQAQRQQYATGQAGQLLGQQQDIQGANAAYQSGALGNQAQLMGQDVAAGLGVASEKLGAAQSYRDAYMGAQQNQFSSQLGADAAGEAARQQWEKDNSPANKFKQGLGIATLGILGS